MAVKKQTSQAERVASNARKNSSNNVKAAKKPATKDLSAKKNPKVNTEYDKKSIPGNVIAALVSIALCILFLISAVNPEGVLLKMIQSAVLGMIGQIGFYVSIPALLYIFVIQTFGMKNAPKMRTFCVMVFVLCCGMFYHLLVQNQGTAHGFALFADLYRGGIEGISGGVICGGLAMLLRWGCGSLVSYIILSAVAILCMLGAFQITIPSIIRAIANRPRDELEEEEEEQQREPAAIVVDHFANKQIERKRRQRMIPEETAAVTPVPAEEKPAAKKKAPKKQPVSTASSADETAGTPARASNVMNTIDLDISAPVGSRRDGDTEEITVPVRKKGIHVVMDDEDFDSDIPKKMPELQISASEETSMTAKQKGKAAPKAKADASPAEDSNGKVTSKDARESARQVAQEIAERENANKSAYCFPPIDLLDSPAKHGVDGTEEMRENSRRLNETLASFNIDAHIVNVTRGPSVTRYEVELDKGVRLNKLTGCAEDIALSLGASGVRIAAVPGRISVVGIEVPNRTVTTVSLREVIDSQEFSKAKSKSSIALGKDIGGSCIIGNVRKMPHLLIAGTTGSGKSVCMNSIIISLLYKSSPEDLKLIMVDPKMVELGIYNGIPHLLIPVITDPKKAAGSLQWAVTEMLRRYKMMSDLGARDMEAYNSLISQEEGGQKLPQIVVIIDELADLMMVAAKEVEDSICRIAQMGRAAGMHLIIATQRPSANVITGLMKANIPSRIAFSVASAMESRIILDTMGAEKLVGRGDMLYAPIGSGKPVRVQGCFVSDKEVEAVAGYVKENYVSNYNQDVLKEIEKAAQQAGKKTAASSVPEAMDEELAGDEMLPEAVDVILETGQASVSMLQRRLKLGYARAARIVDEMEEKGIVGPFQGSKPRAILITKEQWQSMRNGKDQQLDFDDLEEEASDYSEE